jgi:hypothetical protein
MWEIEPIGDAQQLIEPDAQLACFSSRTWVDSAVRARRLIRALCRSAIQPSYPRRGVGGASFLYSTPAWRSFMKPSAQVALVLYPCTNSRPFGDS